jgi:hypothetical protein
MRSAKTSSTRCTGSNVFTIHDLPLTRMSEPEIARRCLSCGASVRARALFCSQCGNVLSQKPAVAVDATDAKEGTANAEDPKFEAIGSETAPLTAAVKESESDNVPALPNSGQADNAAVPAAHDTIHRGTAAVRDGMEDDLLHRVQRLRKMSNVVLDEASYDPSLRFVLVAAALFVVFLLILIMSRWIA